MKIKQEILIRNQNCGDYIGSIMSNILQEIKFPFFSPNKNASSKNICQLTGKTRWVIRPLKSSRFIFRKLADSSSLEGWNRGSW